MSELNDQPLPPEPVETPKVDAEKEKSGATQFYKEQANNLKSKVAQIETERQQLAQRLAEIEESKMRESSQFKELADKYKTDLERERGEYGQFKEYFIKEKKYSAIQQEALKMGIREEALNDLSLLDNSNVEIETTSTGKVNILGAKEYVENLKTIRPYWFKGGNPPIINNGQPTFDDKPKQLTGSQILELQKKDYAAYTKAINEMRKK